MSQRALAKRTQGDREYLELTLIDNNAGTFVSLTLSPSFTLEIPDLVVADVSVSYAAGGHRAAADVYQIFAQRRAVAGGFDVCQLHSITEGERDMPEQWRLVGPMFVRIDARATGNGPTTGAGVKNHLLAGVVLSPAQPMCRDEWLKRVAEVSMVPVKTFSSQD